MKAAVAFEYEWMADGTMRLRFLDGEENILGQQIVAADGLLPLHLLVSMALLKVGNADPQAILIAFHQAGLEVDLAEVTALTESTRLHAGLTPGGNFGIRIIEEEDQDDLWM